MFHFLLNQSSFKSCCLSVYLHFLVNKVNQDSNKMLLLLPYFIRNYSFSFDKFSKNLMGIYASRYFLNKQQTSNFLDSSTLCNQQYPRPNHALKLRKLIQLFAITPNKVQKHLYFLVNFCQRLIPTLATPKIENHLFSSKEIKNEILRRCEWQ